MFSKNKSEHSATPMSKIQKIIKKLYPNEIQSTFNIIIIETVY